MKTHGACSDTGPSHRRFGLTARESELLPMLAQGYSNQEIARALSISVHTIKHHCSHIYDKLWRMVWPSRCLAWRWSHWAQISSKTEQPMYSARRGATWAA